MLNTLSLTNYQKKSHIQKCMIGKTEVKKYVLFIKNQNKDFSVVFGLSQYRYFGSWWLMINSVPPKIIKIRQKCIKTGQKLDTELSTFSFSLR